MAESQVQRIRITDAMKQALDKAASDHDRTASGIARDAIAEYLWRVYNVQIPGGAVHPERGGYRPRIEQGE